jgi:hypothetical protein
MNTIKPTYITFEQSKLLKKRGFGMSENDYIQLFSYYDLEGNLMDKPIAAISRKYNPSSSYLGADTIDDFKAHIVYLDNSLNEYYLAPEQWQVIEWLRANRGIWIEIYKNASGYGYIIQKVDTGSVLKEIEDDIFFDSPQEATSAAIDYVLKDLI